MVMSRLEDNFEHKIVHTGQNYDFELNELFFNELGIRKPDFFLGVAGATPSATIAKSIELVDEILAAENPDAVLILGDTNSCLSIIAAKKQHIPIFHMEAGNRCFDSRVPEEVNRKIVDHTSDINLTYSEHARRNLLQEGLPSDQIFNVGSPMKEIFNHYMPEIEQSKVLADLKLQSGKYLVGSLHREENVDDPKRLKELVKTIGVVAEHFDLKIIFSTHPRTRERLDKLDIKFDERFKFVKALGFFDFIKLQQSAFCVVSDSGTLTEEASLLGFPAVTLREAHERPEGTDNGTLIISGSLPSQLITAVSVVRAQLNSDNKPKTIGDYEVTDVSWRVLKIILSFIEYVDKRVWYK